MKSLRCPNRECPLAGVGSIIRYGFYNTSSGKRRRYRCLSCAKTFWPNTGCLSPIVRRSSLRAVEIKELPGSLIRKKLRTRLGMQTNLENPLHQQTLIRFSPR